MSDSLSLELDDVISKAAVASAAIGTITSGSDVVVSNFAGLADLIDSLADMCQVLKDASYYSPVGSIVPFAGSSEPSGWVLCDGRSLTGTGVTLQLKTVLEAASWTAVPDLRGRTVLGAGTGTGLSARSLRDVLGAETLPAHTHTFTTSSDGSTVFPYAINQYAAGSGSAFTINVQSQAGGYVGGSFATANAHTHSGTTNSTGTGSHGVMQPSLVLNYIIKA